MKLKFVVERRSESGWQLLEPAVEASTPADAVARAATDEGRYRVRPRGEPEAGHHVFFLPAYGPPEPLTA